MKDVGRQCFRLRREATADRSRSRSWTRAKSAASRNRRLRLAQKRQERYNIVVETMVEQTSNELSGFDRDILEWNIPEEYAFCMSFEREERV